MRILVRTIFPLLIAVHLGMCSFASVEDTCFETPNGILEKWRWHKLNALEEYHIYCGTELKNKDLLFATNEGLIRYDGYEVSLEKFQKELAQPITYDIEVADDGWIYLNTSIGLLAYDEKQFRLIVDAPLRRKQRLRTHSFSLFAKNADGLIVTGLENSIYRLDGGKAKAIIQIPKGVRSMISIADRLIVSPAIAKEIHSCDFTFESIIDPSQWRIDKEDPAHPLGFFLLESDITGEAYAFHYLQDSGVYKYSSENESWERLMTGIPYKDQSFFGGVVSLSGETLIFGKSSAYTYWKGQWSKIDLRNFDIPINGVFSFRRANGCLIIGGRGDVVVEIDLTDKQWQTYQNINFCCEDNDNHYWFIGKNGRILAQNLRSRNWEIHDKNVIDHPNNIFSSSDGMVWAVGSHNGQAAIARYDGDQWQIDLHQEVGDRIAHRSPIELSDHRILFGSGEEDRRATGGLIVYEKRQGKYTHKIVTSPIVPPRIPKIVETKDNRLWFGGASLTWTDSNLKTELQTIDNIHVQWFDDITSKSDGTITIGTWENGILAIKDEQLVNVEGTEDLKNYYVSCLHSDIINDETIWVASENGISRLSPDDIVLEALPHEFGFLREEGLLNQTNDGALWINETDRVWYFVEKENRTLSVRTFRTTRYAPDNEAPKVSLLEFNANATAPANVLFKWYGEDKWCRTPNEKLRYSYRIDDREWSSYSSSTEKLLIDFPAGKHQFDVRVKDIDGNTAQLASPVEFEVYPPLWRRTWFLILLFTGLLITSWSIISLIRQRIKHVLELDELKLQFFTNMSHELRTPLMLIINPLEQLVKNLQKSNNKEQAKLAYKNSKKMLHLVDQILEFRKIEYGKWESNLINRDIFKEIKELIDLHQSQTEEKSIQLLSNFSHDTFDARYDSEKLERVLSNLINNSIKYTESEGFIRITCKIISNNSIKGLLLGLTIEDSGVGIELENQSKIFEPFYRESRKFRKKERGVGLGLPLVKNLLESIGGSITVESPIRMEAGKKNGTRFNVTFPLEKPGSTSEIEVTKNSKNEEPKEYKDEEIVLIVDDDKEIREYIGADLKSYVAVEYAKNGKAGFEKAKTIIPDLIVTDVLMPEMDGNELCESIRNTESTSHIPIIALTALKNKEHELKSLTKGADDFITKPISVNILRQKVLNIMQSRKILHEKYQQESPKDQLVENSATITPSKKRSENQYVAKITDIVIRHLEDPLFDVEQMSAILGMSRMTLYRKIKAVTGETPSNFIRHIRLEFSTKLLKEDVLNISEIADRIGYQDVSQFSRAFKKQFNCTPSQYNRNQNRIAK